MFATYKQNAPLQITENTKKLQTNRQEKPGGISRRVIPKRGSKGPNSIIS